MWGCNKLIILIGCIVLVMQLAGYFNTKQDSYSDYCSSDTYYPTEYEATNEKVVWGHPIIDGTTDLIASSEQLYSIGESLSITQLMGAVCIYMVDTSVMFIDT